MKHWYRILFFIAIVLPAMLAWMPARGDDSTATPDRGNEPAVESADVVDDPEVKEVLATLIATSEPELTEAIRDARAEIDKYKERVRSDEEEKSKMQSDIDSGGQDLRELKERSESIKSAANALENKSCEDTKKKDSVDGSVAASLTTIRSGIEDVYGSQSLELKRQIRLLDFNNKVSDCESFLKVFTSSKPAVFRELDDSIAKFNKNLDEAKAELAKRAKRNNGKLLGAWKTRLSKLLVSQSNAKREKAGRDFSDLPVIIGILGVFSLSIMVMVRRFPAEIQRQWVETGQVIQFMTVTVIIIAILSLGLAGKLQQESLGTLLGAIGGYVLAQGIGRIAAKKSEEKPKQSTPPDTDDQSERL